MEVMEETTLTDMKDREDYISKHTSKVYKPLEKSVPKLVKKEYKAFKPSGNKRSNRFRIIDCKGVSHGCSYAYLIDWTYTPDSSLIITMSSRIITIEGENLKEIENLLLDEKLRELQEFNENIYKRPGEKEPVIEKIEIENPD